MLRVPTGITHVVLDTPGGLHGFELARVVLFVDAIIMPVCNSMFDRESATACHAELMTLPRIASGRCLNGLNPCFIHRKRRTTQCRRRNPITHRLTAPWQLRLPNCLYNGQPPSLSQQPEHCHRRNGSVAHYPAA